MKIRRRLELAREQAKMWTGPLVGSDRDAAGGDVGLRIAAAESFDF